MLVYQIFVHQEQVYMINYKIIIYHIQKQYSMYNILLDIHNHS